MAIEVRSGLRRRSKKLRLLLEAVTGQGKTGTALMLAMVLASQLGYAMSDIAIIDAEQDGAAALFESVSVAGCVISGDIRQIYLPPPDRNVAGYREAVQAAVALGAKIIVIDGITQFFEGRSAAMDKTEGMFSSGGRRVSTEYKECFDWIMGMDVHVLATVRMKAEYKESTTAKGKTVFKAVGQKPDAKDGIGYEFDGEIELRRDPEEKAVIGIPKKSRAPDVFDVDAEIPMTPEFMRSLYAWLQKGGDEPSLPVDEIRKRLWQWWRSIAERAAPTLFRGKAGSPEQARLTAAFKTALGLPVDPAAPVTHAEWWAAFRRSQAVDPASDIATEMMTTALEAVAPTNTPARSESSGGNNTNDVAAK